jgi:hypothetical protein
VWWFVPAATLVSPVVDPESSPAPVGDDGLLTAATAPERIARAGRCRLRLPSQTWWQLGSQLRQAAVILAGANVTVAAAIEALRAEVGPHWSSSPHPRQLPGHSLTEYDIEALRRAPSPWGEREWRQLQALRPGARLRWAGQAVPGVGLGAQAQWLQLRVGTVQAVIDCELGPG